MQIGEAVDKGIVANETLGYFLARIQLFLVHIGIDPSRLRFRQHMENPLFDCLILRAEPQILSTITPVRRPSILYLPTRRVRGTALSLPRCRDVYSRVYRA